MIRLAVHDNERVVQRTTHLVNRGMLHIVPGTTTSNERHGFTLGEYHVERHVFFHERKGASGPE